MIKYNFKFVVATLLFALSFSLSASNPLSGLDLVSPNGGRPNSENTLRSIGPVLVELRKLGPVGLQRASEDDATLTLVEKFSDGSSFQRVFKTAEESERAIAKLPKSQESQQKNDEHNYYATNNGSYYDYATSMSFSYTASYGSHDGLAWVMLHISIVPL